MFLFFLLYLVSSCLFHPAFSIFSKQGFFDNLEWIFLWFFDISDKNLRIKNSKTLFQVDIFINLKTFFLSNNLLFFKVISLFSWTNRENLSNTTLLIEISLKIHYEKRLFYFNNYFLRWEKKSHGKLKMLFEFCNLVSFSFFVFWIYFFKWRYFHLSRQLRES